MVEKKTTAVPEQTDNEKWAENKWSYLFTPPTELPVITRMRLWGKLSKIGEQFNENMSLGDAGTLGAEALEVLREYAVKDTEEFDKSGIPLMDVWEIIALYRLALGE
ncbi:hypothetical protein [Mobiluncus mulieris]|uniref:hypothetical protein n=1 Tax=Mobiluncus mulieris TaxID=2052 RepID=UPI00147033E3|nr:hypothetical protein [Mobiluncus mulieris]NMX11159.1 hypothetical protein [Mobiluncus mulieris]